MNQVTFFIEDTEINSELAEIDCSISFWKLDKEMIFNITKDSNKESLFGFSMDMEKAVAFAKCVLAFKNMY